jgi:hypothetical protein
MMNKKQVLEVIEFAEKSKKLVGLKGGVVKTVISYVQGMFGGLTSFNSDGKPSRNSEDIAMKRLCKALYIFRDEYKEAIDANEFNRDNCDWNILFEYLHQNIVRMKHEDGFRLSVEPKRMATTDRHFGDGDKRRESLRLEPIYLDFVGEQIPFGALHRMQEDYRQMELYVYVFNRAINCESWNVDKLVRKYASREK